VDQIVVGKRAHISQVGQVYEGQVVGMTYDPTNSRFILLVDLDLGLGLKQFTVGSQGVIIKLSGPALK
jgi:hypothetical protein